MDTEAPLPPCVAFKVEWQLHHGCLGHISRKVTVSNVPYTLKCVDDGRRLAVPHCLKDRPVPVAVIIPSMCNHSDHKQAIYEVFRSALFIIVNTETAPVIADVFTRLATNAGAPTTAHVMPVVMCLLANDSQFGATPQAKILKFAISDCHRNVVDADGSLDISKFINRLLVRNVNALTDVTNIPVAFNHNWINATRRLTHGTAWDYICAEEPMHFTTFGVNFRHTVKIGFAKPTDSRLEHYQIENATDMDVTDQRVSDNNRQVRRLAIQQIPLNQLPHFVNTVVRMTYTPDTGVIASVVDVPQAQPYLNAVFTTNSNDSGESMRATVFRPLLQFECVDKNEYVHIWAMSLFIDDGNANSVAIGDTPHPSVLTACAALENGGDGLILNQTQHAWVSTVVEECHKAQPLKVLHFSPEMDDATTPTATLFSGHLDFKKPETWPSNVVVCVNPDQTCRSTPSRFAMMAAAPAPLLAGSGEKRVVLMKQAAGTGKTTTLCAMAILMALDGIRVQFLTAPHLLAQTAIMILEQRRHAMTAATFSSLCRELEKSAGQKRARGKTEGPAHVRVASVLAQAGVGNILLGVFENGQFPEERCDVCMVDEACDMFKSDGQPLKKFDMSKSSVGSCRLLIVASASFAKRDPWMRHVIGSLRMWHPEGRIPMGCTFMTDIPRPGSCVFTEGVPDIEAICNNAGDILAGVPQVEWINQRMPWAPQLAVIWATIDHVPNELRPTVAAINTAMCTGQKLRKVHNNLFNGAAFRNGTGTGDTLGFAKHVEAELLRILRESTASGDGDDDAAMETFMTGVKRDLQLCDSTVSALAHIAFKKDGGGGEAADEDDDDTACCICMDSIASKAAGIPVVLPCGHIFHADCVSGAVHNNVVACPMCRKRVHVSTMAHVDMTLLDTDDTSAADDADPDGETTMQNAISSLLSSTLEGQTGDVLAFVPSTATVIHTFRRRPESVTAFRRIKNWIEATGAADMQVVVGVSLKRRRRHNPPQQPTRTIHVLPFSFATGLNLHKRCDTVLVLGYMPFNLSNSGSLSDTDKHQIEGRLRRIGQTHHVLRGGMLVNQ